MIIITSANVGIIIIGWEFAFGDCSSPQFIWSIAVETPPNLKY
jgi:hypothetical protein